MNVLLVHIDGSLPNIALMRLAAHHRAQGDTVEFTSSIAPTLWDVPFDRVYASTIFEKSQPRVKQLLANFPNAIIGGTGSVSNQTLEEIGIGKAMDYSIYPNCRHSIGFTQRGCRLKCGFCVVPKKEGNVREDQSIAEIWRGDPWPREVNLLDNDFFGQPNWQSRIDEIRNGDFKVSFSQGINARMLTDEAAAAIGSVKYYDDGFKSRRIYTAWDNRKDEARLFTGLERLVSYGVRPDHIMVYMLIGYWPDETAADREYRRESLRAFGARPYPMPFKRTPELVGFQRWVIGAYDKKIKWSDWESARYRPEHLGANP